MRNRTPRGQIPKGRAGARRWPARPPARPVRHAERPGCATQRHRAVGEKKEKEKKEVFRSPRVSHSPAVASRPPPVPFPHGGSTGGPPSRTPGLPPPPRALAGALPGAQGSQAQGAPATSRNFPRAGAQHATLRHAAGFRHGGRGEGGASVRGFAGFTVFLGFRHGYLRENHGE